MSEIFLNFWTSSQECYNINKKVVDKNPKSDYTIEIRIRILKFVSMKGRDI